MPFGIKKRYRTAFTLRGVIAGERSGNVQIDIGLGRRRKFAGRAGTRTLFLKRGVEPLFIERNAAFARYVSGQVVWETIGIVQLKDCFTRQRAALKRGDRVIQQLHPVLQRPLKLLLFFEQYARNVVTVLTQLRVSIAHFGIQRGHQLVEKRLARAHFVPMAYRAANDATQHIASPLVTGHNTVADQERARANVVGNNAQRRLINVRLAGKLSGCF